MAQAIQFNRKRTNKSYIPQRFLQIVCQFASRRSFDGISVSVRLDVPGNLPSQKIALEMILIKVAARTRQPLPVYTEETMSAYES